MALLDRTAERGLLEVALRAIAPVEQQVVRLDRNEGITGRNFEYADLLRSSGVGQRVGAVVEKDGSALIYLASVPESSPDIGRHLAQLLGNRGETALLLDVHRAPDRQGVVARAWPCLLDVASPIAVDLTNPVDARAVLGDLQEGLWGAGGNAYQEQRLRDLLVNSVAKVSAEFLNATTENWREEGGDQKY